MIYQMCRTDCVRFLIIYAIFVSGFVQCSISTIYYILYTIRLLLIYRAFLLRKLARFRLQLFVTVSVLFAFAGNFHKSAYFGSLDGFRQL